MPLLRSRMRVHRGRFRAGIRFFAAMAVLTLGFATALIGHYLFGWW